VIASAEWKQGMLFDGKSESGHVVHFDATPEHAKGLSPMEAVLTALCGCTSVDVVSILEKKREALSGLTVTGRRTGSGASAVFTHIHLTYRIRGKVSQKAAEERSAVEEQVLLGFQDAGRSRPKSSTRSNTNHDRILPLRAGDFAADGSGDDVGAGDMHFAIHGGEVSIPDLKGMSVAMRGSGRLRGTDDAGGESALFADVPAGRVANQSPAAGPLCGAVGGCG